MTWSGWDSYAFRSLEPQNIFISLYSVSSLSLSVFGCGCVCLVFAFAYTFLRLFTMQVWLVWKLGGGCRIVAHNTFYVQHIFPIPTSPIHTGKPCIHISQKWLGMFCTNTCSICCCLSLCCGCRRRPPIVVIHAWLAVVYKSFHKCLYLHSIHFLNDVVVVVVDLFCWIFRFRVQLVISSPSD